MTGWEPGALAEAPYRSPLALPADHAPAGEETVRSIHETVHRLVDVDVRAGGNEAAQYAVPALRAVRGTLCPGRYRRRYERDLYAAAAELAELTGWLLCDANRQREAWRANQLSIAFARRCGHRSIELFVTHNMSLQATYLRRPRQALDLVRPVLEQTRLTARLGAMFRLRVARAYAQMGLGTEAFRALRHARSLLLDGVNRRDPAWAWWVSERGFRFATAAMHGTLGQWRPVLEKLRQVLATTPTRDTRDRFLYLCMLLHAEIEMGVWRDAADTAKEVAALVGVVGSDRPLARLMATIEGVPTVGPRARRLAVAVEPVRAAVRPRPRRDGAVAESMMAR